MIASITGTVVSVADVVTKEKRKPYRAVQLLQTGDRGASLVRLRLWNGTKVELGKPLTVTALVDAFSGTRGGALLSVDVF